MQDLRFSRVAGLNYDKCLKRVADSACPSILLGARWHSSNDQILHTPGVISNLGHGGLVSDLRRKEGVGD